MILFLETSPVLPKSAAFFGSDIKHCILRSLLTVVVVVVISRL
jgi:hypothetical protein